MAEKSPRFMTGKDQLLTGIAEGNADDGKASLVFLIEELNNRRPLTNWFSHYPVDCLQKILDNSSADPFALKSTAHRKKAILVARLRELHLQFLAISGALKGGAIFLKQQW